MSFEAVAGLRKHIYELDAQLSDLDNPSSEMTVAEMGEILLQLNLAKRDVGLLYDSVSNMLGKILKDKELLSLPGGAQIEKKSSYDRKGWKHSELASVVLTKLEKMSVDMDTGEVLKSPRDIAMDLLKYCAPSYWRIKELNSIGINADDYCEVGELKTSIIVRKGENQ